MSKNKKVVAVICGGRSREHEVSLQSAYYVFNNLDRKKYQRVLLGIDKKGHWHFASSYNDLVIQKEPLGKMKDGLAEVVLVKKGKGVYVLNLGQKKIIGKIDIFFPLIHGPYGEDGCLQGYLELLGLPYVGADVLGSALAMDKEYTKRLLQAESIPVTPFMVLYRGESKNREKARKMVRKYRFPLFVKPACLGSSIGISKAFNLRELKKAITLAFHYDNKIILEKGIKGREIECSVLGNKNPQASLPGEIKPRHNFYSYAAKYLDSKGADLLTPALLSVTLTKKVQQLSQKAFQVLSLKGMARIDFFLSSRGKLIVNEVNTIPGFTQISMYPKLWQVSGLKYSKLLDKLLKLAEESYQEKKLKFNYKQ